MGNEQIHNQFINFPIIGHDERFTIFKNGNIAHSAFRAERRKD
jgi:hypothetical protein